MNDNAYNIIVTISSMSLLWWTVAMVLANLALHLELKCVNKSGIKM